MLEISLYLSTTAIAGKSLEGRLPAFALECDKNKIAYRVKSYIVEIFAQSTKNRQGDIFRFTQSFNLILLSQVHLSVPVAI